MSMNVMHAKLDTLAGELGRRIRAGYGRRRKGHFRRRVTVLMGACAHRLPAHGFPGRHVVPQSAGDLPASSVREVLVVEDVVELRSDIREGLRGRPAETRVKLSKLGLASFPFPLKAAVGLSLDWFGGVDSPLGWTASFLTESIGSTAAAAAIWMSRRGDRRSP